MVPVVTQSLALVVSSSLDSLDWGLPDGKMLILHAFVCSHLIISQRAERRCGLSAQCPAWAAKYKQEFVGRKAALKATEYDHI